MGMPVFVNVIWDPTMGMLSHTWWDPTMTAAPPPGVPKPNTPNPSIEMIATQMWTAGYALGLNKFTAKTLHLNVPICIADHDQGILIPDLTIPPPNLWYVIQWPFSGRKMTFQASTVQMDGQPTSCSQLVPIPLPMMTCGDPITAPTAFPLINFTHTLTVGMTLGDFLMGLASIAISIAIDAFFEWGVPGIGKLIGGKAGKEVAAKAADTLGPALAKAALGKLGLMPKDLAKKIVSGLAGWGLAAGTGQDNPTFKVGVGGGPVPEIAVTVGGPAQDPSRLASTTVGGVPVAVTSGNTPTNDPLNVF